MTITITVVLFAYALWLNTVTIFYPQLNFTAYWLYVQVKTRLQNIRYNRKDRK